MKVNEIIKGVIGKYYNQVVFLVEHPADERMGDYACNVAMVLSKTLGKNPRDLAVEIVDKLKNDDELDKVIDMKRIEVAGPGFINFWVKKEYLLDLISNQKIDESWRLGRHDDPGKLGEGWATGKVFEVEHTSPNPNKAMHIGHLRNNVTGMAIANMFEDAGAKVIRECMDNNRGIAIAKLMWGYLKFARRDGQKLEDINYWHEHQSEWLSPEELKIRPDIFVDGLYVKGADDFKSEKEVENKVRKMVVAWESEEPINWELWRKVLGYSYAGQKMTLSRLGSRWDKVWHESDHYKAGKDYVRKGLEMGIFRKLDDGAILTDLEKFGITDTIVQKSDGTSLYITQDLALTELKKKEYGADKMFWVIGPEQALGMKQMFAVCEQLGIGKKEEFSHASYGYMTIKGQGKMSSREGNVLYIDDLLDIVKKRVLEKIADRDFSEVEKEELAEKLAVGAVKYSILKVGRTTDMAFDVESSISFDGDSAPYLNYVFVRTQSLLAKAGIWNQEAPDEVEKINDEEIKLLRWIDRYSETIERAGLDLAPNLICGYLLELSQRFNAFYGNHKILDDNENRDFRLKLTSQVGMLIKNGLKILGIEVVERM